MDKEDEKECRMCLQIKSLDEFYSDKRAKDGRQARCKKCHTRVAVKTRDKTKMATAQREYQERNRDMWKTLPAGTTKRCTGFNGKCHHEKGPELPANTDYFNVKAKCKYGLDPRCTACTSLDRKRRYTKSKED